MNDQPIDALMAAFPGAEVIDSTATTRKLSARPRTITSSQLSTSGCSCPIQLSGTTVVTDATTGNVVYQWSSERDEVGGTIAVPCKTRRAAKCPSCATLYQGDAYRLIVNGLRGGDTTPNSIRNHPAVFVTFTAPGFGPVHTQRPDGRCRPRRNGETCPHGADLSCPRRHGDGDRQLGQAIAPCCFDYGAAVNWNAHAGKLWRATRIAIDRALAHRLGITVRKMRTERCRTNFVKIAEFQARGVVHFHILVRVDGIDGQVSDVGVDDLVAAIRDAHTSTDVASSDSQRIGWGQQLDIKVIDTASERERLAGYFAKYATKSADAQGLLTSRIGFEEQTDRLPVNRHHRRLVRAAWELIDAEGTTSVRRWAHQFGFGGHFLTKSKSWSTTFKALRQKRRDHQLAMARASWQALAPEAQLVIESRWDYIGRGYQSPTQAHLAALQRTQAA